MSALGSMAQREVEEARIGGGGGPVLPPSAGRGGEGGQGRGRQEEMSIEMAIAVLRVVGLQRAIVMGFAQPSWPAEVWTPGAASAPGPCPRVVTGEHGQAGASAQLDVGAWSASVGSCSMLAHCQGTPRCRDTLTAGGGRVRFSIARSPPPLPTQGSTYCVNVDVAPAGAFQWPAGLWRCGVAQREEGWRLKGNWL